MTVDRLAALEAALRLIAAFEGKTLIMMSDDPHERQAYSLGAHRAFAQASGIASRALDSASPLTTPTPDKGSLERARRLANRLAKHFIGEQFAAEDETCSRCVAMVADALTAAEAEARAAERERWMPMIRAALGVAFADNDKVLAVSRVAIGAAMKDLDDYCKAALATPAQSEGSDEAGTVVR